MTVSGVGADAILNSGSYLNHGQYVWGLCIAQAAIAVGVWLLLDGWPRARWFAALGVAAVSIVGILILGAGKRTADASADQLADEVHEMHERMGRLLAVQARVPADPTAIADAIGAAKCVELFNVGWKIILASGNEILKSSEEVMFPKFSPHVDWSTVRVVDQTDSYVVVRAPFVAGYFLDGLNIGARKDEVCSPRFSTGYGHVMPLDGSAPGHFVRFAIGATVLKSNNTVTLVAVGIRRQDDLRPFPSPDDQRLTGETRPPP